MKTVKAGIVGGTGYTGSELIKILQAHAGVELISVMSRSESGQAVNSHFPALATCQLTFTGLETMPLDALDVLFFATPHGVAAKHAQHLVDSKTVLIDLSADFRFKDVGCFERWYGLTHPAPELLQQAVYGLPELYRAQLTDATIVANPGCYPTCVQLALAPLVAADVLVDTDIVVDAKSGASGAGRQSDVNFSMTELDSNFFAYGCGGHRHQPEITESLNGLLNELGRSSEKTGADLKPISVIFVPHLLPFSRGIETSLYVKVVKNDSAQLHSIYRQYYEKEPFVQVMPPGSLPKIKDVVGTNRCHIGINVVPDTPFCMISAVLDNLIKGAAGQAVQNMNRVFKLPETTGLDLLPFYP